MKNFVIVGGGTAGWMAAMILAKQWQPSATVTLIESPDVGIIGVGEGSTPALAMFFKTMQIAESEWMPACNATYKCGIRFNDWSGKGSSYFHPFPARTDFITQPTFFKHADLRQQGADISVSPDSYYLANILAGCGLAPIGNENFPFELQYGYHFDAGLLGAFLREKAKGLGVIHKIGHVTRIENNSEGDITQLTTKDGEILVGDYFIDCTGFVGLLLQQHLQVPFTSYRENLFNNAAVTLATPADKIIPAETRATALTNGWAWQIPLTNRYGNGYVYADSFISADQAETELRTHLGLLDSDISARHLKMNVGSVKTHWCNNCLGVGLSQGFIEPLEATALMLVQQTLGFFVEALNRGNFTPQYRDAFNARINDQFEGVRDYIVAHYKMSGRTDTEYWRANMSEQTSVSAEYKALVSKFSNGQPLSQILAQPEYRHYYPAISWYSLILGLKSVRESRDTPLQLKKMVVQEQAETLEFLRRCALNFSDQRDYLMQLDKFID